MRASQYMAVWLTVLFIGGVVAIGGAVFPPAAMPFATPVPIVRPAEAPPTAPTPTPPPDSAVVPAVPTPELNPPTRVVPIATATDVASAADALDVGAAVDVSAPNVGVGAEGGVTDVPDQLAVTRGMLHRAGGVPILMYHYIRINPVASDTAGYILSVTPDAFNLQMQFLAERGYHTVTMATVREFVRHGSPLPSKPIALTFDDGYDDAFTAAKPVLDRYGMTATFYIVTGFLDRLHYMTWDQVVALDGAGMEIGSHTVHHVGLTLLSGLRRRYELTGSQADLESRLGHSILDFCYPGGEVDAASEISVRQAGYLSATTTASGFAEVGDDPLHLPRVRVSGGEGLAQFARLLDESIAGVAPRVIRPVVASTAQVSPIRSVTPTATPTPVARLLTPTPSPPSPTSTPTPPAARQ